MSVLIIGDMHYQPGNITNTEIAERDIYNILCSYNISFVVILGDILHTHEKINMDCFIRACNFIDMIRNMNKHVFLLIGNHDRPNHKVFLDERHAFNLYKDKQNITVVDTCFVYEFIHYTQDVEKNYRFCFVPYVPDGRYLEALETCNIDPLSMNLFFSHSEFDGCKINKLTKKKCDKWELNYPKNISGHIHNEEWVQDNLFYTGTPFQHDFNDDTNKGVFLMELDSGNFNLEKIRLTVPSKVLWTVHYTQLQTLELDPSLEIRLKIIGPISQVKSLMNRHDMIAKFGHISKRYEDESKKIVDVPLISHSLQFYEKLLISFENNQNLSNVYKELFPENL